MGKVLDFKPVHLAIDPNEELIYCPPEQDQIPEGDRLRYMMRVPTKRVLEKIQNGEMEIGMEGMSDGDTQYGRIKSGTTRKQFIVECLTGWCNLYREDKPDTLTSGNVVATYMEVIFQKPSTHPGSSEYEKTMMQNFECIPEPHVTEIVRMLRKNTRLDEESEGKSKTITDSSSV